MEKNPRYFPPKHIYKRNLAENPNSPNCLSLPHTDAHRSSENGEVPEAKQGGCPPPGAPRRPEGHHREELRRRHSRPPLRPLPRRRHREVPEQGHSQGFGEEAGEEIAREGVREAGELQPHHAHALHARRGSQGHRLRRRARLARQEGDHLQGGQVEVRGEVQDRQEPLVFLQAKVLSRPYSVWFAIFYGFYVVLINQVVCL